MESSRGEKASVSCLSSFCKLPEPQNSTHHSPYTVYGILQARILERVSLSLLQGIFLTQGSKPGLQHCRRILYLLSHKGSPGTLEWVAQPFSRGIFLTQERNKGLLHCRRTLYQLSYQGSPSIQGCSLNYQQMAPRFRFLFFLFVCFLKKVLFKDSKFPWWLSW